MASRSPWLTTLVGNGFLIVGTAVYSVLALLTFWIPPRGRAVQFWARRWARELLWCAGVRVEVESESRTPLPEKLVVMANHQSLFDIPVLIASLPVPALFMAKRELFQIPLFGWALRAGGFIPVDRRNQKRARESFRQAVARLGQGGAVLLFPEETRSVDGQLLPFKRGGFLLARKAEAAILPVGIEGTLGVQERSSYLIRGGLVTVRYGHPRSADAPDLAAEVRHEIERLASIPARAPDPGADAT